MKNWFFWGAAGWGDDFRTIEAETPKEAFQKIYENDKEEDDEEDNMNEIKEENPGCFVSGDNAIYDLDNRDTRDDLLDSLIDHVINI